jgi:hypothetical protein
MQRIPPRHRGVLIQHHAGIRGAAEAVGIIGRAEDDARRLPRLRRPESVSRASIVPWVFHRTKRGRPLKGFRKSWIAAGRPVRIPGRIPNDFRRTAVRNLERAGVPRSTAMAMVGHRTESIYRRYAIVDEVMLREGGAKLAAYSAGEWTRYYLDGRVRNTFWCGKKEIIPGDEEFKALIPSQSRRRADCPKCWEAFAARAKSRAK